MHLSIEWERDYIIGSVLDAWKSDFMIGLSFTNDSIIFTIHSCEWMEFVYNNTTGFLVLIEIHFLKDVIWQAGSNIHVDMDSEPIFNYNSLYVPPCGKIFHSQLSRCHLCQFFHRSEDLDKYFLNPRPVSVVGKVSKKDMNFSILWKLTHLTPLVLEKDSNNMV